MLGVGGGYGVLVDSVAIVGWGFVLCCVLRALTACRDEAIISLCDRQAAH
jgi:hypothetical protein